MSEDFLTLKELSKNVFAPFGEDHFDLSHNKNIRPANPSKRYTERVTQDMF